ncbi:uncharacterized protein LOC8274142 [Ricinus communis]|uniref:Uncharacterized protein n=1 Tax=Ricinus communis TaxID=3988 RepID=B9RJB0_RICCO|nr:uncharacterized protein LOC8274142 [Ricinus communis]EEF48412.1 conserved hypothetical protein [Ricinus communis]|eukprot:XP_002513829.1 uncharacterized protein LOC8274142 [Ricinus communis]
MRKQEPGKDVKDTNSTTGPNTNRVIITVYVESPGKRLHQKIDLTNKATTNPLLKRPQFTSTEGYNRRAELLAYSRELRNGGPHQTWQRARNSRPEESKMWKWSSIPVRIRASLRRMFRRNRRIFRYERIRSEKYSEAGQFSRRQKRAPRRYITAASYCRKLKHVLKELSCGVRCRKGL